MNKVRRLVLLFLFSGCLNLLVAQQNNRLSFSFKNFNSTSGLSGNQLNTIVQDSLGYMWIGGTDGIQRFDGIRFKTFRHRPNDSTSIPINPVMQLLLDKKGRLWVLSANGQIGTFNTSTFKYKEAAVLTKDSSLIPYNLKKIVLDDAGNVFYLVKPSKIFMWNEEKNEFSTSYCFIPQRQEWLIEDISQQHSTRKYWFSIVNRGLGVFDKKTGRLSYAGHNTDHIKIIDRYSTGFSPYNLFFDSKGRLWFQFWESSVPLIYCYDLEKEEPVIERGDLFSQLRIYHETGHFMEDSEGNIWIIGNKVFGRFNEKTRKFELVQNGYTNVRSIEYEAVTDLYEDREKNMWACTNNNGLFIFSPSSEFFTNISHNKRYDDKAKGTGSVYAFREDKDGSLLAGTWGEGLYRYDSSLNLIPLGINGIPDYGNYSIWCIAPSNDHHSLWISSQPGLWRYDQDTRKAVYYNPPALESRTIRQVAEDRFGNLWLGMQNFGLKKWNPAKGASGFNEGITSFTPITPNQNINKILVDSRGYIWVACAWQGVYMIDPADDKILLHFSNYEKDAYKLLEQGASTVMEYNDSLMVLATPNRIYVYNRNKKSTEPVGTSETMSGYTTSIERDSTGFLWVTTTSGLYRVTLRTKTFILFDRRDGIANENFEIVASYKMKDGRILFGSTDQFISYHPDDIKINDRYPPAVHITDFRVKDRHMWVDSLLGLEKIVLSPNQNAISVDFSSLQLVNPYMTMYKMEGLDKDWRFTDKTLSATYSYLPSGNYTLLLKTLNAEGNEGPVTRLKIRIEPPFWESWWFYCLLALLAVVLFFWIDRERIKRKEAMYKIRSDIADELHQEVNLALNNINILSEMARLKAGKDTNKAIEYIEQINIKSQSMMNAMGDMLWIISPENDSMAKNIDHLNEYIDTLSSRYNTPVDLLVDKKVYDLKPDMKMRQYVLRLFKGGIANFLRTGGTNCKIHIGLEKNLLTYIVEFDNTQSDLQQLNNLVKRQELEEWIREINATLDIQTHKTSSVVTLKIPVR